MGARALSSELQRVRELGWGVIGTGGIAAAFVEALRSSKRCRVVSVAASSPAKARAFAERWRLPHAAEDLSSLLVHPDVGAVYVASPHPLHEPHVLAAIGAGRAVLCEKPLAIDSAVAERLIAAARAQRVFLMEAFMYRCHPLLTELIALLRGGVIGEVAHVRSSFGFRAPRDPHGRLFDPALGGGSILDVGGYPVSFARLIAGLVEGKPFAEPDVIQGGGRIGPTGVDELAFASLTFASGFSALVASAIRHELGTITTIYGEAGRIELPDPWLPRGQRQGLDSELVVYREGMPPKTVRVQTDLPTYAIEAELVSECLSQLEAPWPAMSWTDTLGNMRVMEAWRAQLGSDAIRGGEPPQAR